MMQAHGTSVFDGLASEELAPVLERLERRRFPAGMTLFAEGESAAREVYIVQAGAADVFVVDAAAHEHFLSRVGPGATLGEMALFTGQVTAAATVRAATDLDVLVLDEVQFHELATAQPRIYRNLGNILAERLARANRHAVHHNRARISLLIADGAPPMLGYALAASVAWHTRGRTLLLHIAGELPAPLRALAALDVPALLRRSALRHHERGAPTATPCTELALATPDGAFGGSALAGTLEDIASAYDHVLVQLPRGMPTPSLGTRTVWLAGRDVPLTTGRDQPALVLRALVERPRAGFPNRDGTVDVPPLTSVDDASLRDGTLPASTSAGRALGWCARELAGLKVGLALGAGGIKGYAHIGALQGLARLGVPVDCIAGTSIGAAVGALHALGYAPNAAAQSLDDVGGAAFRFAVPRTGLLSSAGLRAGLRRVAGRARIEDLRLPLAVVAADIVTQQEVVFRRGLLWPAVLASMSIPGIYPPQRFGHAMLVDGGILNPVPSNIVAGMGADAVVAVKLASRAQTAALAAPQPAASVPWVLQAITRSIEVMQSRIVADTAAKATILIEPAFDGAEGWGLRNFSQGRRYIALGEEAVTRALPRLATILPWLR